MTEITDIEGAVLAMIARNSKPFASGKGGLEAEEIARAVGPIGSRVLVNTLIALQRKQLLVCVHTDEHEQHRKLYYLTKP
jgi:DNA-binding HxlR family transcriptional regulator